MRNMTMVDETTMTNAQPCTGLTIDLARAASALRTFDVQGVAARRVVEVAKPQAHAAAGSGAFGATTGIRLGSPAWSPPL